MKYIIRKDRNQISVFPHFLDEAIYKDHEVRIIDLFVDSPSISGDSLYFSFHTPASRRIKINQPKDIEKQMLYERKYFLALCRITLQYKI